MTKKVIVSVLLAAMLIATIWFPGCAAPAEEEEEEEIPESRILYVAVESLLGTESLDPRENLSRISQALVGPAFDSLLAIGSNGLPIPGLATSWEPNEDYTVWTLHLREGVQFHDGWGEMTADDVEFSLERFTSEDSLTSLAVELRSTLNKTVVKDPYTIELHLNAPSLDFVEYYLRDGSINCEGMVMSKSYWEAVGDGRWKFVEFRPGDGITFDAIEDHWTGAWDGFDRVVLMEVPEEGARTAMLKSGEADLIIASVDTSIDLEEQGYDVGVVDEQGVCVVRFYGTWRPELVELDIPWRFTEVRHALSLAIENLFAGLFDPVPFPATNVGPSGVGVDVERIREWAEDNYVYDPAEARRLLAEAGYPNGFPITALSYEASRATWQPDVWQVIASYWAAINVTLTINPVDYDGYFRPMTRQVPHPLELITTANMHTFGIDPFPITLTGERYAPDSTHRLLDPSNAAWMELARLCRESTDPVVREKAFNDLLIVCGEDYSTFSIFFSSQPYVVSDKVGQWSTIRAVEIPSLWLEYFKPAS
jgi:peptide/nickel transport system substrate-binding protein